MQSQPSLSLSPELQMARISEEVEITPVQCYQMALQNAGDVMTTVNLEMAQLRIQLPLFQSQEYQMQHHLFHQVTITHVYYYLTAQ